MDADPPWGPLVFPSMPSLTASPRSATISAVSLPGTPEYATIQSVRIALLGLEGRWRLVPVRFDSSKLFITLESLVFEIRGVFSFFLSFR